MNEHPITDAPSSGLNRRAALKKVAVGGAIAWTAPTLISGTASAANGCTPSCAPNLAVTTGPTVGVICDTGGFSFAYVDFTVNRVNSCPCEDNGTVVVDLQNNCSVTTAPAGVTTEIDYFLSSFDSGTNTGRVYVKLIGPAGATTPVIGDYTLRIGDFTVACEDGPLDVLTSVCTADVDFTFDATSCSATTDAGDVTKVGTSCGTPVCTITP